MTLRILAVLLLVILGGYGSVKAYPLLRGPEIHVTSPTKNETDTGGLVTISGIADHTETLMLNDAPLLMDEMGAFSEELLLPQGSAILSLTAYDRFGRSVTERRAVFVP
jgi:hypothetical protein